jgi:hypothetical protein
VPCFRGVGILGCGLDGYDDGDGDCGRGCGLVVISFNPVLPCRMIIEFLSCIVDLFLIYQMSVGRIGIEGRPCMNY